MRRRVLSLLVVLVAAVVSIDARPASAQNPLDALKKRADEARKKVEEAKRKADSTTAAAKRKADAGLNAVDTNVAKANGAKAAGDSLAQALKNPLATQASAGAAATQAVPAPAGRGAAPAAPTGRRASQAMPVSTSGGGAAKAPRSAAKIEQALLVNGEPNMQYVLSPRNQHLAAVLLRGSRMVVVHDGVDGPKFDDIVPAVSGTGGNKVVFSDDGEHFAYLAKSGDQYVIMADGRELVRGGPWTHAASSALTVRKLDFSPGGKHVWFTTHKQPSVREEYQLFIDGKPGPISHEDVQPLFSPDGERHTYLLFTNPLQGQRFQTLIVDGKPAAYLAGDMKWTADSKSLITTRGVPGVGAIEVLVDGRPVMRAANVQIFVPPVGPGFFSVAWTPFVNGHHTSFLTVGAQKVAGSECSGNAGIDRVVWTPDAKHWAAHCEDGNQAHWVMVDGKKGQTYQTVAPNILFTADGCVVYRATMNGKQFVIVGDKESEAYQMITAESQSNRTNMATNGAAPYPPAVIGGSHVAFIAQTNSQMGRARNVMLDGKATVLDTPGDLEPSPDGSRWAVVIGIGASQGVAVDMTEQKGLVLVTQTRNIGLPRVVFSPDSKHVAYSARVDDGSYDRGIALDGQYVRIGGMQDADNLAFSPDGRHLAWIAYSTGTPNLGIYLDGEMVMELPNQNLPLRNEPAPRWTWLPDGSLSFVAQEGDQMKRFRVTPTAAASVETMLSRSGREK